MLQSNMFQHYLVQVEHLFNLGLLFFWLKWSLKYYCFHLKLYTRQATGRARWLN